MKNIFKLYLSFTFLIVGLFIAGCASGVKTVGLDKDGLELTIREATDYLNEQVPKGHKLAIINITSNYRSLSEYIISELNANIVNDRIFSLVDRQQLDTIRAEQNFQLSGEVDDESAQALGKLLGAQTIITGTVSSLGNRWRIQIRALEVQTAQVQGQFNRNIDSIGIIADLTSGSIAVTSDDHKPASNSTPAASSVQPTSVPALTPGQTYAIGDNGPAGGIVFYDKGYYTDGWRYLEYAPSNFRNVYWGPYGLKIAGTETGIGTGKKNTELIVKVLNRRRDKGLAAQICNDFSLNGYKDWFLPSKDELNLLYTYLKDNVMLGSDYGFYTWFYSSSYCNDTQVWGHNFTNGYQGGYNISLGQGGDVLAVRAF
jgi:TolB-like protein